MAFLTVTNTFVNSTTADATAVNQNFTDILNGTSDGTKDFSIAALTCSGAVVLNNNVTLGDSASDTITPNALVAGDLKPNANNSINLGSSTLGYASMYLGSAGGFTTRLLGGATSSYTITFPATSGSTGYFLNNSGSGALQWSPIQGAGINYSLVASVATNALTIALKGADGNDPSSTNKVVFDFRNSTATTGTPSIATAVAATSVVVSSGSTLGHSNGVAEYIYVYAINNAGTIELAVCSTAIVDEGSVVTTTAEGGAGAADSLTTLYSTNARVGVGAVLIGRIKSSQATAGTWVSSPTEISLKSNVKYSPYSEVHVYTGNGCGSTNTVIRRFSNTAVSLGSDITYADSSTAGGSFTINAAGVYIISYTEIAVIGVNDAVSFGISKNSTQLTTGISTITNTDILQLGSTVGTSGNNGYSNVCVATYLKAGDVIRAHLDTGSAGLGSGSTNSLVRFVIKRAV